MLMLTQSFRSFLAVVGCYRITTLNTWASVEVSLSPMIFRRMTCFFIFSLSTWLIFFTFLGIIILMIVLQTFKVSTPDVASATSTKSLAFFTLFPLQFSLFFLETSPFILLHRNFRRDSLDQLNTFSPFSAERKTAILYDLLMMTIAITMIRTVVATIQLLLADG